MRLPWREKQVLLSKRPWWEEVRCDCVPKATSHNVRLIGLDGALLGTYRLGAANAHQLAHRITDRKFGLGCGEFVVSSALDFTANNGTTVTVDVRAVALVEIGSIAEPI